MVLDFANEADEIKAAFEPYYETTLLSEATDPNLLYEIQTASPPSRSYTEADVEAFAKVSLIPRRHRTASMPRLRIVEHFRRSRPKSSTTSGVSSPTTCASMRFSPRS